MWQRHAFSNVVQKMRRMVSKIHEWTMDLLAAMPTRRHDGSSCSFVVIFGVASVYVFKDKFDAT